MRPPSADKFDPYAFAVLYYFGDLRYWKLPDVAMKALENGYDGVTLRWLAGLTDPVASDIPGIRIDAAFKEMGLDAPLSKDEARLVLAADTVKKVIDGGLNAFDVATYIRIHLCELHDPPELYSRIVSLSKRARVAPRSEWNQLERDLTDAMREFYAAVQCGNRR